jgi:electron transport complex protein RnfB
MQNAIISLGALGLVFGLILAIASHIFKVEVDERTEKILDALPNANCGGCGYPGCSGYAEAIVQDGVAINKCAPGGADTVAKIAEIMGVTASKSEKMVAIVKCRGDNTVTTQKHNYVGVLDCVAANITQGGDKGCAYGCLGLGTCVSVCAFDAIRIENGIAVINPENCTACGKCVEACPRNIIEIVPYSKKVHVTCKSVDKGPMVKKVCDIGCIACRLCEKVCPVDAIHVDNNLASIDYDKCIQCMLCVEKCPVNIIIGEPREKKVALIGNSCVGCTICKKNCPVDAISGELKQKHEVDPEKCIGCGICVEKCPKKAIELVRPS